MKNILITASVIGAAVGGVYWIMKNRNRAEEALDEVKSAAKNAYRKMSKAGKASQRKAERAMDIAVS